MAKKVEKEQVLSEEQLSKEFKEYSVAEFFKRNRQMLGYTGKVRSMTTVVHEFCSNSVTWDTPTLVRIGGEARLDMIGGLVDGLMLKNGFEYSPSQDVESLRNFEKFEVLCFDKHSNKLKFKLVKSMHRHKMGEGEKIFRIKTVGNRSVEATRHHGLFTLKNGEVVEVKADELSVGDFLVVPRKPWAEQSVWQINLLEEALKLGDSELGEFSVFGVRDIIYSNNELKNKIKTQLNAHQRHYDFYGDWMKCDRLPARLLKILTPEERSIFYGCKVGVRQGHHKLDCILPASRELMQFLGLFIAEGSSRTKGSSASISFGSHEKELIDYTAALSQNLFGIRPKVKKSHATATSIVLCSGSLVFLLRKILRCGEKARSKKIPSIVFSAGTELAREFLFAYLAGDGYPSNELFECLKTRSFETKQKICLATASRELALGLQYLLSALGYSYSYQEKPPEQRVVKNVETVFGESFKIEFYTNQKASPLNFYPLEIGGITAVVEPKLKYAINTRNQASATYEKIASLKLNHAVVSEKAAAFLNGGLGVLQVTEIEERTPFEGEYVYDYSVDEDENFVGGYGAICLHNSLDACEDATVLPDILVEVHELRDGHYKVIVEDNGTGIPRKNVGQAFGKLLAGTKFMSRKQKRGQQGLGGSYCVLFSQITTGKETRVKTGIGDHKIFECDVSIDINKNEPLMRNESEYSGKFRGTRVELELAEVEYNRSSYGVYEYLRRTAVANPHAQITLIEPNKEITVFPRASTQIPKKPRDVLPHPLGLTTSDLIDLAGKTDARKIGSMLQNELSRVSGDKVKELAALVGDVDLDRSPKSMQWSEAEKIVKAVHTLKWIAPETDALIPIGEKQVEKSLKNLLQPEELRIVERPPKVFRGGIAFSVEAAIAFGGKAGAPGSANGSGEAGGTATKGELMRFANRVPLLFDAGADAITEAVKTIDWNRYDLKDWESRPVTLFVNFTSVFVPYTGAGKLAIAQEEEIVAEIRYALMECARGISTYLHALSRAKEQEERRTLFFRYIPEISQALAEITGKVQKEIADKLKKIAEKRTAIAEAADAEEEDDLDHMEKAAQKEMKESGEEEDE